MEMRFFYWVCASQVYVQWNQFISSHRWFKETNSKNKIRFSLLVIKNIIKYVFEWTIFEYLSFYLCTMLVKLCSRYNILLPSVWFLHSTILLRSPTQFSLHCWFFFCGVQKVQTLQTAARQDKCTNKASLKPLRASLDAVEMGVKPWRVGRSKWNMSFVAFSSHISGVCVNTRVGLEILGSAEVLW